MLLLNDSAILSWASRPVFGSGRANNGPAVEKASLVHPPDVGPFPDPVEMKVSANYQQAVSPVDSGLDKPAEKLSELPSSPKNHSQPRGYRPKANLVTRSHARPVRLGESRFSRKFSVFWKEVGMKGRKLKKRVARLLRSVPSRGRNFAEK